MLVCYEIELDSDLQKIASKDIQDAVDSTRMNGYIVKCLLPIFYQIDNHQFPEDINLLLIVNNFCQSIAIVIIS